MLESIAKGEVAWCTPDELAAHSGFGDETGAFLEKLDAQGMLNIHEESNPLTVSLSTKAARLLGVRLVSPEKRLPYWSSAPVWPERSYLPQCPDLDGLADSRTADDLDEPRRPTHLVGSSLTPWPGPKAHAACCPGCHNRKLKHNEYCLVCDAWGLESQ